MARLRSIDGGLSSSSLKHFLENAFEKGIRFFDIAPSYAQSQVEQAIGRLNPRFRHEVFFCSKFGYC